MAFDLRSPHNSIKTEEIAFPHAYTPLSPAPGQLSFNPPPLTAGESLPLLASLPEVRGSNSLHTLTLFKCHRVVPRG